MDTEKLTPEQQQLRHTRTMSLAKKIVGVLPKREPLDHVVLACASVIASSVAALPDEQRDGAMDKVVQYMRRHIAWSDDVGHTEHARTALRRARH